MTSVLAPNTPFRQFALTLLLLSILLLMPLTAKVDLGRVNPVDLALWAFLVIAPGILVVDLPRGGAFVSASTASEFGSIVLFGPAITAWLVIPRLLIDLIVIKKALSQNIRHIYTLAFNLGQYVLTICATGLTITFARDMVAGKALLSFTPYLFGMVVFFTVNSLSANVPAWLVDRALFWRTWLDNFGRSTLSSYFGLCLAGYFMAKGVQGQSHPYSSVVLVLLIIWLVRNRYRDQATIFKSDEDSLAMIATSLEARDASTDKHSELVAEFSLMIGEEARLEWKRQETLRRAARTHDLGKITTRDKILFDGHELTAEEYGLFKNHPIISEQILIRRGSLKKEAKIARYHHENYDGSGYPDRLKGDQIPLESRMIRVADAFHAMISPRPYRRPHTKAEAILELQDYAGRQFDPQVVRWFLAGLYKREPDLQQGVARLKREVEEKRSALRAMGRPECFADYRCIEVCQNCVWLTECNEQTREGLKSRGASAEPLEEVPQAVAAAQSPAG